MAPDEVLKAHLPKLPALDEEDLKAVRGFLPGRLLGRTAAALALMVLTLSYAGLADQLLRYLSIGLTERPAIRHAFLFGLPILIVVSQVALEWGSRSRQRVLQRLALQTNTGPSGYFRIGPYLDTKEDRDQFVRADRAHEKVRDWIMQSSTSPLYLTGDSGSGKSSLLGAFVLPALRAANWTIVETRAFQDPELMVRNALTALVRPRRAAEQSVRSMIERLSRQKDGGLLILLDQFEEFIILAKSEQRDRFANMLANLQAQPIKGVRLLLSFRSDYQTLLEETGLPKPLYGENLFHLGRFTFSAASSFFDKSGLNFQPTDTARLLTSAAAMDETPGLVRPITLNVIGYVLESGQTVTETLDAQILIRRYIEQVMSQPAIRDYVPSVLEQLVTDQGTKQPRTEGELITSTNLRRGEVRAVLNGLAAAALARPLDAAQGIWELSHDFVARAVSRVLGRRPHARLRQAVFYAAPLLLALLLFTGGGLTAWYRLRSGFLKDDMMGLGLAVLPWAGGIMIEGTSSLTQETFSRSEPLLKSLETIKPVMVFNLKAREITKLEPLKGMNTIRALNVAYTQVVNLEPLQGMTVLRSLDLWGTQITDLAPLGRLTGLQEVSVGRTHVTDLSPLDMLPQLTRIMVNTEWNPTERDRFTRARKKTGLPDVTFDEYPYP
jgi:hypothetical protein